MAFELFVLLRDSATQNISNSRDSVSSRYVLKHREESWNYDPRQSIFYQIRIVWIVAETLTRMFDKSLGKQKNMKKTDK